MLNVLAEPNEWTREVKQSADATISELKQQQLRFWQGVRSRLLEKKSKVRPQKAHPQHWADYRLGRANTWLSATVNSTKKSLSVEFNFRGPPGKIWFDELLAQRAEVEKKFGHPLAWQRLDNRKQSRIALYRENSNPTDESDWPSQHVWLVEQLERFYNIFQPIALSLSEGSDTLIGEPDELVSGATAE